MCIKAFPLSILNSQNDNAKNFFILNANKRKTCLCRKKSLPKKVNSY